jgi:hypothetical protein
MHTRTCTAWLMAATILIATPALASQHIAGSAAQQQAMTEKDAAAAAARATVVNTIHRADVQALAARMGVDLKRAETAARTLPAGDVTALAQQLRSADDNLAGGSTTVTISLTTLLLVLILIVLIAK